MLVYGIIQQTNQPIQLLKPRTKVCCFTFGHSKMITCFLTPAQTLYIYTNIGNVLESSELDEVRWSHYRVRRCVRSYLSILQRSQSNKLHSFQQIGPIVILVNYFFDNIQLVNTKINLSYRIIILYMILINQSFNPNEFYLIFTFCFLSPSY